HQYFQNVAPRRSWNEMDIEETCYSSIQVNAEGNHKWFIEQNPDCSLLVRVARPKEHRDFDQVCDYRDAIVQPKSDLCRFGLTQQSSHLIRRKVSINVRGNFVSCGY